MMQQDLSIATENPSVLITELQQHCIKIYQQFQIRYLPHQTINRIQYRYKPFEYPRGKIIPGYHPRKPLDFIDVYKNEANVEEGIPQHWHYIGFGLSDIYNGFYPDLFPATKDLSGFGLELTFRLKCNSLESWNRDPPKWPEKIMQTMAFYVHESKNVFNAGDHLAWNRNLNSESDDIDGTSRIQHVFMALDPQLTETKTQNGKILRFIQIVGVFKEELEQARQWQVKEILNIMRAREETGGKFLVTDMERHESIFELDQNNRDIVKAGILQTGSDMACVSTKHKYSSLRPSWFDQIERLQNSNDENEFSIQEHDRIFEYSSIDLNDSQVPQDSMSINVRTPSRASCTSDTNLEITNLEMSKERLYDSIYLLFNYEAGKILPVVLNGRLKHKRPFHFKTFRGDLTTTLVPEGYMGCSLVSRDRPFVRRGPLLQIYISEELLQQMQKKIEPDFIHDRHVDSQRYFKNYCWPENRLYISVINEIKDSN